MVHLKDFSLLCPTIQSSDLLKAIETAIPATAIEEAIASTQADEERRRVREGARCANATSTIGNKSCNCNESMVKRLDARCT